MSKLENNNFLENADLINSTLKFGSRNLDVKKLQNLFGLQSDGIFGKNTEKKVKEFQKNNNLIVDGIVGKNTREKLNFLIKKPKGIFSIEKKLKDKKQEIFEKSFYNEDEITNISEKQKKEKLELEQSKNRENFNIKQNAKTQIENSLLFKKLDIYIINDNGIKYDGEFIGDDTGKTFSLGVRSKFILFGTDYKLNSDFSHYTSGEKFYYNQNGERDWVKTDFSDSTRIDYLHLDLQKNVYNKKTQDLSIDGYLGGGVDLLGDYGGEGIQKSWHEQMGYYEHKAKYENINGFSPTINGSIELEKILYDDKSKKVYAFGDLEAQLALIGKYGTNNLKGNIGVGAEYKKLNIELSHGEGYQKLATNSKTISRLNLDGRYSETSLKISSPVPLLENSNISYKYTKSSNRDYISLNYEYKF